MSVEENSKFKLKGKHILSFSIVAIEPNLMGALLGAAFLKYITDVGHMDIAYYSLAMILYAIVNSINDPLLGIYSNKYAFRTK